ncbi:MAG: hypothetical protein ACM3WP_24050 [Acidobacteriota bacterium]
MYGDDVMRLRREIVGLKKQLGEKVIDNSDLFMPHDVGPKEYEKLHREQEALMERVALDERRQDIRARAMRELEQGADDENQRRPVRPIAGAGNKPRKDNSDLFVDAETFKRTGGM